MRQCWNLYFEENTFIENIGCPKTNLMLLQCTLVSDPAPVYTPGNDSYTILDGSKSSSDTEVYFDQQTMTDNYVGRDKSLISIEGFDRV